MKRTLLAIAVLFAAITASLLARDVKAAEESSPCQTANVLREAGFFEEAHVEYLRLLAEDPQLGCALTGIQSLPNQRATRLYRLGQVYEAANQLDLAHAAYTDALEADPGLETAQQALKKLSPLEAEIAVPPSQEPEDEFAVVRTLVGHGFDENAMEVLDKAIKEKPELVVKVPDDLEYLLGPSKLAAAEELAKQGFDERAKEILKQAIEANPELEVPDHLKHLLVGRTSLWRLLRQLEPLRPWGELGIVVIIVLLFVLLVGHRRRFQRQPWLWIDSRLFHPRLDIKDFDSSAAGISIGPGMAAIVEEELMRLASQSEFRRWIHMNEESDEIFKIPANVKSAIPSFLQIVFDLIEWMIPQNAVTLMGRLQMSEDRGAGLTLTLVEKRTGNILGNQTIWSLDYDPTLTTPGGTDADAYYALTKPAASWPLFELAKWRKKPIQLLGTENWTSYACLQAGVEWRLQNEMSKAKRMFMRALELDRHNRGALFNLGALNAELGEYEEAQKQLHMAMQQLKARATEDPTQHLQDAMRYKIMYYQTSVCAYDNDVSIASEKAKELVEQVKRKLNEIEKMEQKTRQSLKPERKGLKEYLVWLEPVAVTLYVGILIEQGRINKIEDAVRSWGIKPSELHYRARYNLACCYSVLGEKKEGDDQKQTEAYRKALKNLRYVLEQSSGIVQWAKKDPSLRGVRKENKLKIEGKTFAKLFEELVEEYADPGISKSAKPALGLADLKAIGKTYAKQLKEQGIVSTDDLILKAGTPSARVELEKKLGISASLLLKWALLADLMRIVGINTQYANLLEAADVDSLQDLKRDPDELQKLLEQVNQARSLVDQVPQPNTVLRWVKDAFRTNPKVR